VLSLLIGAAAFALLIFSDFLALKNKKASAFVCALAGLVGLLGATAHLVGLTDWEIFFRDNLALRLIAVIVALSFLSLLIYTLFFALPASKTYSFDNNKLMLVDTGVYAICRHPGVIWLGMFYFFAWLATSNAFLLIGCVLFTIMDIVYVVFQDIFIFPKTINRYFEYKKYTPFLIPTRKSLRRAFKKGGCAAGEERNEI